MDRRERGLTALALAVLAALTLAATAGAIVVEDPARRRWYKMTAASGFVAVAVVAGATATGFGRTVFAGLLLAWIGDLLLTYRGTRPFLAGLTAFLAAHVVYAIAFVGRGLGSTTWLTGVLVGAAAVAIGRWLLPRVPPRLRSPVIGYVVAISVMLAVAVGTHLAAADVRIPAGALLFFVSDLAVANDRFMADGGAKTRWGLPAYFGGQLLLAWAAGG